ncbi:MAG: hypothetical protein J5851_09295 [Oscillospiraceae bacterium]|nr:hypothetical protein [Oscillospiraceae bacterium]
MNYSIIEKRPTQITEGVMHYIVTLCCDTAADVPEPEDNWDAGSIAQICDPHGYCILNSEGVWK